MFSHTRNTPDPEKIKAIIKMPIPTNVKLLLIFSQVLTSVINHSESWSARIIFNGAAWLQAHDKTLPNSNS